MVLFFSTIQMGQDREVANSGLGILGIILCTRIINKQEIDVSEINSFFIYNIFQQYKTIIHK